MPNVRVRVGFADGSIQKVLGIPFVRGLNDEKGPMRRVEPPRQAFEAGNPPHWTDRRKGPDEEFSVMTERYSGSDCARRENWPNHQVILCL